MNYINLTRINDWSIRRFLIVVMAVQIAIIGLVSLDFIGLEIPVVRQLIGFVYLTFIPGIVLLRVLKIHNLSTAKNILYSVGLSLAFCMIFGLLLNTLLPLIGILKPISEYPLLFSYALVIFVLCILAYFIDRDFYYSTTEPLKKPNFFYSTILLLIFLPLMSIIGSLLVNFYANNIILLLLMILIAFIVILVAFDKFPSELFSLMIFSISLAILYHGPLISNQLFGSDMAAEYLTYKLTALDSFWSPSIFKQPINSLLSVSILPNIYSSIMNLSGILIFKLVFPVLIGFVPVTLYFAYRKLLDKKTGFFAAFFFISYTTFFSISFYDARIGIAEFFLALLILLMIDKDFSSWKRSALIILFIFSLIISYYAISYLFIIGMFFVWLVLILWKKTQNATLVTISSSFLALCLAFSWAVYATGNVGFTSIEIIIKQMYENFWNSIFSSSLRDVTMLRSLGQAGFPTLEYELMVWIYRLTQVFIIVGVLLFLWKLISDKKKSNLEYGLFSFVNISFLAVAIVMPYFVKMGSVRLYQMTLVFLAPFCIIGGIGIFNGISKFFKKKIPRRKMLIALVMVVLIPYFLFNSGFLFEVTKDDPVSIPLSKDRMIESDSNLIISRIGTFLVLEGEIESTKWLSNYRTNLPVYSDEISCGTVLAPYGLMFFERDAYSRYLYYEVPPNCYVYLRHLSVVYDLYPWREPGAFFLKWNINTTEEVAWFFNDLNEVYSNGVSEIYYRYEEIEKP